MYRDVVVSVVSVGILGKETTDCEPGPGTAVLPNAAGRKRGRVKANPIAVWLYQAFSSPIFAVSIITYTNSDFRRITRCEVRDCCVFRFYGNTGEQQRSGRSRSASRANRTSPRQESSTVR